MKGHFVIFYQIKANYYGLIFNLAPQKQEENLCEKKKILSKPSVRSGLILVTCGNIAWGTRIHGSS